MMKIDEIGIFSHPSPMTRALVFLLLVSVDTHARPSVLGSGGAIEESTAQRFTPTQRALLSATVLIKSRRFSEAIPILKEVLEDRSVKGKSSLWHQMSFCLNRTGENGAALEAAVRVIKTSPDHVGAHGEAGIAAFWLRRDRLVIHHLTRHRELGGSDPETTLLLCLSYARSGRARELNQFLDELSPEVAASSRARYARTRKN